MSIQKPNYPIFKTLGRTGATRYTPRATGDKFGRSYIYSQDSVSIEEYDRMRSDGQVKAGLMLMKLPIMSSPWSVECEDLDIASFVESVMKKKWKSMLRAILRGIDFGYSCQEIEWTVDYNRKIKGRDNQEKIYPRCVIPFDYLELDPKTFYILAYTKSGSFAGVRQYIGTEAIIPESKLILYSNDCEFREWYGVSRLKPVYPYWAFKTLAYEWTNVHYETFSVPTKIGYYPAGSTEMGIDGNGDPIIIDNQDIMQSVLESLGNNDSVSLPMTQAPVDGKAREWEIKTLESGRGVGDHIAYIDHLNLQMLKALLIPQLALETGDSGSYALAQTQVDFFFANEKAIMDEIAETINEQIINKIVKFNFGKDAPEAHVIFSPIPGSLKEGINNLLLETLGTGKPIPTLDGGGYQVDWAWVAKNSGIPLTYVSPEDIQKQQEEEQQQQAQVAKAYDMQNNEQDPGEGNEQNIETSEYGEFVDQGGDLIFIPKGVLND
jgi:phage gp29-like protein